MVKAGSDIHEAIATVHSVQGLHGFRGEISSSCFSLTYIHTCVTVRTQTNKRTYTQREIRFYVLGRRSSRRG